MSEDKTAKAASGFLASLLAFIPTEFRAFVGFVLGLAILYAIMSALIFMPTYFKTLAESNTKAPESCWDLREIQNVIFKFNRCTGEAIQIEIKARQIASPPRGPSAQK